MWPQAKSIKESEIAFAQELGARSVNLPFANNHLTLSLSCWHRRQGLRALYDNWLIHACWAGAARGGNKRIAADPGRDPSELGAHSLAAAAARAAT